MRIGTICKIHASGNYMGPESPRDFLKATHAGLWKTCWFYEDDLEVIKNT